MNRLFQITQATCFEVMRIFDMKSICEVGRFKLAEG